ncbi:HAD-IA family hydrolase [Marinospirillum sp.]|uniref:HAD-IA family hydrolase n=1 Tax=Marinospirillum sp. TaxID=2183934 RepID=UPI002870AF82|nr:HAD-IA family hydrolase [Marinospirillum sp.]MDR9468408.1 HAD-IA family hydrolase [Marinospirillum sp.]
MHRIQLIIFDLDGTLLDTAPEVALAANDALEEAGLRSISLEQTRQWVGRGAENFLEKALEFSAGQKKVVFAELLARFYYFYKIRSGTRSYLYPFAKEVVQHFHQQGKRLAVLTNKFKAGADKTLQAHGLYDYFDEVLGGDSFADKKPNPVGVHYLLDKYRVAPDEVLFLGDSSHDVQTAHQAGVKVWVFPHGYNHGEPLAASNPDRILTGFDELLQRL